MPDSTADGPKPFVSWENCDTASESVCYEALGDAFPYRVSSWNRHTGPPLTNDQAFCYGFCYSGTAMLMRKAANRNGVENMKEELQFPLYSGMYFSCPGPFRIQGGSGIVVCVPGPDYLEVSKFPWSSFRPLFTVGGPLEIGDEYERAGRLPYIDGGSDTLLIAPVVKGAPCVNYLHFPSGTKQTQHTHPSGRIGIIVDGSGRCVVNHGSSVTATPLERGTMFVIPRNAPHAFETEDKELNAILFHPDSDFGPTPKNHPMLNRTFVDGVSASDIPTIQTRHR